MLSCGCPRSEACAWMFDLPVLAKGSHNWKNFLLSLPHAPWPDGEASRTAAWRPRSRWCLSCTPTRAASSSRSKGLVRWSSALSLSRSMRSVVEVRAEMTIIGSSGSRSRTAAMSSSPVAPGSIRSQMIRSKVGASCFLSIAEAAPLALASSPPSRMMPSVPEYACVQVCPCRARCTAMISLMSASSSTMRIRAPILASLGAWIAIGGFTLF